MTIALNPVQGQYYGVQGTTWQNPPLLASPSGTRTIDGRKLYLYADGGRLTTVAWHNGPDTLLDLQHADQRHPQRADGGDRGVADPGQALAGAVRAAGPASARYPPRLHGSRNGNQSR